VRAGVCVCAYVFFVWVYHLQPNEMEEARKIKCDNELLPINRQGCDALS